MTTLYEQIDYHGLTILIITEESAMAQTTRYQVPGGRTFDNLEASKCYLDGLRAARHQRNMRLLGRDDSEGLI